MLILVVGILFGTVVDEQLFPWCVLASRPPSRLPACLLLLLLALGRLCLRLASCCCTASVSCAGMRDL